MAFLDGSEGKLFDVFVRTPLRNSRREVTGEMWTLRTNGHAQTDLEMAQSLTTDLTRMKVPWQIRDAKGQVVDAFDKAERNSSCEDI